MRAAVVFESWFGNTRKVAEAIADVLRDDAEVQLVSVDDPVPDLDGLDLLVVGAPTHAHGLSSGTTRQGAIDQRGKGGEPGHGIRGWLKELPEHCGVRVAAFDTRIERPIFLVGSASHGIARRLQRRGCSLVAPPESFFVVATAGPLEEGELERASAWAGRLARTVLAPV